MESKEELEKAYGKEVSTTPCARIDRSQDLKGTYVTLTRWSQDYIPSLWQHVRVDPKLLVYMPVAEISTEQSLRDEFAALVDREDIVCWAIRADPTHLSPAPTTGGGGSSSSGGEGPAGPHSEVVGVAFYGHFVPESRATEIGALFAPVLHRTAASTEVNYLLLKGVLDEGSPLLQPLLDGGRSPAYRRVAWKCNALNAPSRAAALRTGYVYEGRMRQNAIVKGRSRDEDSFSIIDSDWPAVKAALEKWLDASNWDADGKQIQKLQQIRAEL